MRPGLVRCLLSRSFARARTFVLLGLTLCVAASSAGCGGEERSTPEDGPMDRTESGTLRLDEGEIEARLGAASTEVTLRLHGRNGAQVAGRVQVDLIDIQQGAVLASGEAPFAVRGEHADVVVSLDSAPAASDDVAALAAYSLHYRVRWDDDALWGRRSLFLAVPTTETQLLAPDTFRTGAATNLRLLTRNPSSGAPQGDLPVRVTLERGEGEVVELFTGRTDALGQLSAPISPGDDLAGEGTLVVSVHAPGQPQELRATVAVERATKILLTTDKPLYQPGQLIHLRALALRRPGLEPEASQPVTFEVFDGKDNKVERVTVDTDSFGVAATTFRLAREVNMGQYRLSAAMHNATTEKVVTVERYSLPKFDIDLELDREVYLAGSRLQGTVRVRYFFGAPVGGGTVSLQAATLDAGRSVFADQTGATNEEGLYRFDLQLPEYLVGLPLEQGGGLVELSLLVVDTAGQSRTVARTVRIAKAPLEVVVVPESGLLVPGLVNFLLVRCMDAAGRPVAAHHEMEIDGRAAEAFDTDADGMATLAVDVPGPDLTVTLTSEDAAGNRVESSHSLKADPAAPDGAVLLRTDRALYTVGERLEIEVATLGTPDRVYLDVIRGGQTVLTQILEPDAAGLAHYGLDLSGDHSGALQIDAYYLGLGSSLRRDSKLVYVEAADGLTIEVESDADVYAPGGEARLSFQVSDSDGVGRATALGVQVVDEAVFGLMEFRPGLERIYFQIEAELGAPRYQIGVPGLPALTADPDAAHDAATQQQARLLFAASDPVDAYPVSINTFAGAQATVAGLVRPMVAQRGEAYLDRLRGLVRAGLADEASLPVRVDSGFGRTYDPWGRALRTSMADASTIRVLSLGPDERAGTPDDVELNYPTYEVLWGADPSDGPWPGVADGEGDFAGGWDAEAAEQRGDAPPNAPVGVDEDDDGHGGGGGAERPRVRRDFPETLFVQPSLITDGNGHAELTLPLADSITTWRLSALGNSADGLLGSTDFGVRVFQDFFVDIDFPATLTRGDEISVPVALYNYLDEPQSVTLEIEAGDGFRLLGPASIRVDLDPRAVQGLRVPVQALRVGLHELTVYALGDREQDAVARTVEVVPDGVEERSVASGRLEGIVRRDVRIPASAIEGSGKLIVKVYPGLFAQVVEGLDGVLRMPSGCFEQTSSSTWPNVLVARYLREAGQVTPEVDATASQYINTGYQRLLTFEVDGGGFEWFGRAPANVVLTAYGLLEFSDMATVRTVDEAMLARTTAWLLAQQGADGSFQVNGRGLDETGNLSDPVTVTAYVAFALAAAGQQGRPLDAARDYLRPHFAEMGTYTLALTSNFLVAYAPGDAFTGQALDELARRVEASIEGEPEQAHWETDEQTTTYGRGLPAYIETTSLATHALLASGSHTAAAEKALDWIVANKDSHGAWGSTAGTVWSIKCLLQALTGGRDEAADATISVRLDGEERASFSVTADNSDVMRQAELSEWLQAGTDQLVEVEIVGEGNLQYGIVTAHHVPWDGPPPNEGPLSITVGYDRTQLEVDDTVNVNVNVTNTSLDYADMVMVDLGIPPGFELVREDLDQLQAGGLFTKYEATERQLLLYFPVIHPDRPVSFTFRIIARDPIRAQAPAARVYSYYNPEVGASTEPAEFYVQ